MQPWDWNVKSEIALDRPTRMSNTATAFYLWDKRLTNKKRAQLSLFKVDITHFPLSHVGSWCEATNDGLTSSFMVQVRQIDVIGVLRRHDDTATEQYDNEKSYHENIILILFKFMYTSDCNRLLINLFISTCWWLFPLLATVLLLHIVLSLFSFLLLNQGVQPFWFVARFPMLC